MAREVTRIIMGVLFLGWLMVTIFYGLYAACASMGRLPGETFCVLKEKELKEFGKYRTRRLVLEACEKLKEDGDH